MDFARYRGKKREGKKLTFIATKQEFEDFIQDLRHNKVLKNDDTTLCRLTVSADVQQQITAQDKSKQTVSLPQNLEQRQQQREVPVTPTPSIQTPIFQTQSLHHSNINNELGTHSTQLQPRVNNASNQFVTTSSGNQEDRVNLRHSQKRKLIRAFLIVMGVLGVVSVAVFPWFLVRDITVFPWLLVRDNGKADNIKEQKEEEKSLENTTDNSSDLEPNQTNQFEFNTPIYSPKISNSKAAGKAIGFLYKKPDDQLKKLYLWVLIPKNYLSDTNNPFTIEIPDGNRIPLYQIDRLVFLGYLLPGTYKVDEPKKPQNPFKGSRWVKVEVELLN